MVHRAALISAAFIALVACGPRVSHDDNWKTIGGTRDEQYFSRADQINIDTVSRLGVAWYADLAGPGPVEAEPALINGVLYEVEAWNVTSAFDARSGKLLWRFDPKVDRQIGKIVCCGIDARGLAYLDGKLFVAALDGRLIALDASTGHELWSVNTFDLPGYWPYSSTGAPRVFNHEIVIGNGGSEAGVRGYVTAYDTDTGKKLWRFFTVPGNPADGFESSSMEMAAKTWSGQWWKLGGGGTVWDGMAYDPKLDLLYFGTANGTPWAWRYRSPSGGDNLFIDSIVAVRGRTGEYVWHYQEVPRDSWDYDAINPLVLADLRIDGRTRHVLMQASKNGMFYVLDRATGEVLSGHPFVGELNWNKGLDAAGRPILNDALQPDVLPQRVAPAAGAHNWQPMAYDPMTGLVYFPVNDKSGVTALDPDFIPIFGELPNLGTSFGGHPQERAQIAAYVEAHHQQFLVAWDPVQHKEVWRMNYPVVPGAPSVGGEGGGVLATAGNLVFTGVGARNFSALRADTGEIVWSMPVGQKVVATAISYVLDNVQYVAVASESLIGRANRGRLALPGERDAPPPAEPARLIVFKLGGTVQLPTASPATLNATASVAPPPPVTGTNEQIARGEQLYAKNCAFCHGESARNPRDAVKDLLVMSAQTHEAFQDVVIGGARSDKGMKSFAELLTPEQAQDIHQYLIKRANEERALN